VEDENETITPYNLHDVMNGLDYSQPKAMEKDNEEDEPPPLKKRSDSSKSATRKIHAPQVSPSKPTTTAPSAPPPTKTTTFLDLVIYPHSRTVIELAIVLKSNKAFKECTQALMAFITNAQMVDSKFVINPLDPNSKEKNISSEGKISPNMTKLGIHIKISGNGNVFNRKKVWGNQANDHKSHKSKKEEFRYPVVWFSMVISSMVPSQEIIDCVTHEWAHLNGTRLQIKDLQSIDSKMAVTFFKASTIIPKEVLLAELTQILHEAQKCTQQDSLDTTTFDFTLDDGIKIGESLPPMNLHIQVVMLKGLPVNTFNQLSHHAQQACRSWHLEVDRRYATKMKGLIQCAKEYGCMEELQGCHAHLSEVTDAKSTACET
jgi:hypothetical protein